MAHGKDVKHWPLGGLDPEDAHALARQLLKDLDIAETRAPYRELRDLLVQLDHHPLAIQLVLTALRDDAQLTLDGISADFDRLLPRFTDDRQTGRNRSLLASLNYSLRRLTEAERQLLARLAPFEGGANEQVLLEITELDEREWQPLRTALERAALLAPEQVGNFAAPFLRFHPVLTPYLRLGAQASDMPALLARYAERYHAVANYLYHEDNRNPLAARELARRELPNLRRALELLLDGGALDEAAELVERIASFLNFFGMWRERDELRRRVELAVESADMHSDGALTRAEWLRKSGRGEDEFQLGNLHAAYARFTALLARHEALPAGAPLGGGSYEHCLTLGRLARCLQAGGQPGAAEEGLRRALAVIDALLAAKPERQDYIRQRAAMLTDLGDALRDQGSYVAARAAYEAGLENAEQLGDTRGQRVSLGQLGTLALLQGDYADARGRYQKALRLAQEMGEPAGEATYWHQLGMVAEEQDWAEAERCYRASLEIKERHGDAAGAATTCNQLAIVAKNSGRPAEAEGWYKRALNAPALSPSYVAAMCNNLANLLKDEVRAGRMPPERLEEARSYAERALKIMETLDTSSKIWMTQGILAGIAELEGDREAARDFRRRERESFAAFAGNRWHIDNRFSELLPVLAAAVRGDEEARATVESLLPQLEAIGLDIRAVIPRLYAGERDWHALTEELDPQWQSLLVLRVLETLEEMNKE
jgi:tetratricopeptide (TPR) repeat protein